MKRPDQRILKQRLRDTAAERRAPTAKRLLRLQNACCDCNTYNRLTAHNTTIKTNHTKAGTGAVLKRITWCAR